MDLASLLILLALTLLVAAFIARPLLDRERIASGPSEHGVSTLRAELENVLTQVQELDLDHAVGKIPDDHHEAARSGLMQRGASLLRQIDLAEGVSALALAPGGPTSEAEIEAAVARLRGHAKDPGGSAGFCGRCGAPVQAGDRFCVRCGNPVQPEGKRA